MSGAKPPRVFLSYSRPDRARVAKLAEALTAAGIAVWWDTAIEGGASFSADIERELDAADVVVVAWSAASVKSTWVLDEAGAGRDRGRLLPVQLDATAPPLGFRQFQAIDLAAWKGRAGDAKIAALVSAIHKLAGAEVVAPVARAAPATTGPSRRALIGGAAGVAALAAGGFGAWKFLGQKADDGTASVVVLPFANLSGDPAQAFFSDGIAEELRNALSQIRGLKVIGRVTSEQFRDSGDLIAAAAKLGVDNVLTGSVRQSPATVRISAQLVDGKTGVESWSRSYDQPIGDSLSIQSKIATSVVAALSDKLALAAGTVVVGGTANAQAQSLFLKAFGMFSNESSEASLRQALALYDGAIALDPAYAEAWARKGVVKRNLRSYAKTASEQARLLAETMAANKQAVALAPASGLARVFLAAVLFDTLDLRNGLAELERAIDLAPANGSVLIAAAGLLKFLDPDRAVGLSLRAVALDPLSPLFLDVQSRVFLAARQFKEAIDVGRQALAMSANQRGGNSYVLALLASGQLDMARANLEKMKLPQNRLLATAIVEWRAGNRAASDAALATLRQRDTDSIQSLLAAVHAQRGETGAALDAIEAALKRRENYLMFIAIEPWFDPIRREPRFKAVQDAIIPPDLWVPPKRR